MQPSLLNEGLTLMLAGMGTVFVFLTALVGAMTTMSALARRLQPAVDAGPTDEEVAAIAAAIDQHRRRS
ncbi:MAG: OadG family protein [Woeseiaceae bacterium]|nr:OadG family protein [Woeseiaceae bacterium]